MKNIFSRIVFCNDMKLCENNIFKKVKTFYNNETVVLIKQVHYNIISNFVLASIGAYNSLNEEGTYLLGPVNFFISEFSVFPTE